MYANPLIAGIATITAFSVFLLVSKANTHRIKIIVVFNGIIIAASSLLFFVFSPDYSVFDAKEAIANSSNIENIELNSEYNSIEITPNPSFFVRKGYVFTGESENKSVKIIFNPVSGDYQIMDV